VERRANGLALWVQHRGLQGNEDTSFHGNFDYLTRTAPDVLSATT
jgi:hypothetical protein